MPGVRSTLTFFSRQHESEKRFQCLFCNNRFKNKNEAERHQNSLHLRRQSWSCAALAANFEAAFFPGADVPPPTTTTNPQQPPQTATDICGYCGRDFQNPPNWDERTKHLDQIHKFRECNQSKKFFRADHFRQHLKHSHAGDSGKWTNRLETACIKEEAAPIPLDQQNNINTPAQSAPVANMGPVLKPEPNSPQVAGHAGNPVPFGAQVMTAPGLHPGHAPLGAQDMPPVDMTNIDPSIGATQVDGTSLVANMNAMGPSQ